MISVMSSINRLRRREFVGQNMISRVGGLLRQPLKLFAKEQSITLWCLRNCDVAIRIVNLCALSTPATMLADYVFQEFFIDSRRFFLQFGILFVYG
jgi:hypothetical protein